ncbi:MAG: MFS transporter [Chloroflexota bacterium]|nr:MFS transporter [Chloroflexota bacterium]
MRHGPNADERRERPSGQTEGGRKALTIVLLAAMLIVHNAQRTGVVPLFTDLQPRFGVNYAGVGTLFAAYVFGYAVFQAVVGLVGDRFNARSLLLTGLTFSALFSAAFAGTRNYDLALVARFLLGATGAFLYTPAMKLGITLFARQERGRMMGILQSGAGLGAVGALILVPIGVAHFGMTGGLLALPAFTVAILIVAIIMLPDAPPQERAARVAGTRMGIGWRPDFWQLLAVSFTGMLATYGLLTWLPTYLTETFGYSTVRAGTFSSAANIALLVAAPLVGMLADLPHGRTLVVFGGSALALACYVAIVPKEPIAVIFVITILVGVSLAATTAPLMLFAGERFDVGETARVVALMATVAQIGATLAGVVFGVLLAQSNRFQVIWLTCAALSLVRLILLIPFFLHRRERHEHVSAPVS